MIQMSRSLQTLQGVAPVAALPEEVSVRFDKWNRALDCLGSKFGLFILRQVLIDDGQPMFSMASLNMIGSVFGGWALLPGLFDGPMGLCH